MNIFISAVFFHNSYARGIMPDVLQTQIKENPGATIYYLTNSHSFDICYFNPEKKPEICYLCKTGVKNILNLVEGDFHHLKISDLLTKEDWKISKAFFRKDKNISFDQKFENFEVGAATLSTYISITRDRYLENVEQQIVRELAENALALYLACKRFFQKKKINIVYNFNGRQEYVRAVMEAALSINIDCFNVERTRLQGNIDFYKNSLPHDPANKFKLAKLYWEQSPLKEDEKKEIGSSFFQLQRTGQSSVFPSYTGKMEKGTILTSINQRKKNLVVFTSSDDEIAALGELFKNELFEDQNEGLKYLVRVVGKNFVSTHNLIIRMHPNLEGVKFKYVQDVKNLHQKYPNIYVIDPNSSVDTYALMDSSEKVISFGSTTGLEANFMGKPVVLLGKGYFYHADYAYIPPKKEDILKLLRANLPARPLGDTLKVGFYFQKGGVKTKYYYESDQVKQIFYKGNPVPTYTPFEIINAKLIQQADTFKKMIFK